MFESGIALVDPLRLAVKADDSPEAGIAVTWLTVALALAEGREFMALIEQLVGFEIAEAVPTWHVTFVTTSADATPVPNDTVSRRANENFMRSSECVLSAEQIVSRTHRAVAHKASGSLAPSYFSLGLSSAFRSPRAYWMPASMCAMKGRE